MKPKLWTKNFTLLTIGTVLGAFGGVAGNFAISLQVFDETGSTLASALLIATATFPSFILPLFISPVMDRMPRKPALVLGDAVNGVAFLAAGIYLINSTFSYPIYLAYALFIASLGSFDQLAYQSLVPKVIPKGAEDRGFSVSGMIYPIIMMIVMPLSAWLYELIGVGWILIGQGVLSVIAAGLEHFISIKEEIKPKSDENPIKQWWSDIKAGLKYMKEEVGIRNIYMYVSVSNGIATGWMPIEMAFFRTTKGFTLAMYGVFAVAENIGRSIGGIFRYKIRIPERFRYSMALFVYVVYEAMDMILLWIPYPLMLINRGLCGFLGMNSATMREQAVQMYIPEEMRARLNAFLNIMVSGAQGLFVLVIGALGEIMDYRLCVTICAVFTFIVCMLTIVRRKNAVAAVYNMPTGE